MKKFNFRKTLFLLSLFALSSVSIFAQTDVARQTLAITYPLDETVSVRFRGTTRFPRISGSAKVKRTSKNGTEIDLSIDNMPRPFELGAGYATYVVWAISPDGQADNLGEIKRRGFLWFDSKMSVTTPFQSFSLLVTAEPHFLVRRPSRQVMIENVSGAAKSGVVLPTARTAQYLGNDSDYFRDPRTPEIAEADYKNTPPAILQAKQAIALARYAGAQTDATDEIQQAETLLRNAETAFSAGRDEEQVDLLARQSIGAAVKAEDTATVRKEARARRNEKTKQDAELQRSEDKVADAVRQMEDLKAELASEQRARELAERDVANLSTQVRELRSENNRLSEELGRIRTESEGAKVRLARLEGEKQVVEQQREQEIRLNRLRTEMPILMQSLKPFGTVRQTERGIVLTLNETYWSGVRNTDFAPAGEAKLNDLSNILLNNKDYSIVVESHTDNKGEAAELQNLTDSRAQTVMTKLSANGVEQNRFEVKGYGASVPVAPNTTNANRAKNRRIDLILIPSV